MVMIEAACTSQMRAHTLILHGKNNVTKAMRVATTHWRPLIDEIQNFAQSAHS